MPLKVALVSSPLLPASRTDLKINFPYKRHFIKGKVWSQQAREMNRVPLLPPLPWPPPRRLAEGLKVSLGRGAQWARRPKLWARFLQSHYVVLDHL